jgi:hypothetical protein
MTRDILIVDWKEEFPEERHIVVEAGDRKKRKLKKINK